MIPNVYFQILDKSQYTKTPEGDVKYASIANTISGSLDELNKVNKDNFLDILGIPRSLSAWYNYTALSKFSTETAYIKRMCLLNEGVDLTSSDATIVKLKDYLETQGYNLTISPIDTKNKIIEDRRIIGILSVSNKKLGYKEFNATGQLTTNMLSGLKLPSSSGAVKSTGWLYSIDGNPWTSDLYWDSVNKYLYLNINAAGDYISFDSTDKVQVVTSADIQIFYVYHEGVPADTDKWIDNMLFADSRNTTEFTDWEKFIVSNNDNIPFVFKTKVLGSSSDSYYISITPESYTTDTNGYKVIDTFTLYIYKNGEEFEKHSGLSFDNESENFIVKKVSTNSNLIDEIVMWKTAIDFTTYTFTITESTDYYSQTTSYNKYQWVIPEEEVTNGYYTLSSMSDGDTEDFIYYNTLEPDTSGTYNYIDSLYYDFVYQFKLRTNLIDIDNPDDIFQGKATQDFYEIGALTSSEIKDLMYLEFSTSSLYRMFTSELVNYDIIVFPFEDANNQIFNSVQSIVTKRQDCVGLYEYFGDSVNDVVAKSLAIPSEKWIVAGGYANGKSYNSFVGEEYILPGGHMLLLSMIYTDQISYPWLAPAWLTRGIQTVFSDITDDINDDDRKAMTTKGVRVNPIFKFKGKQITVGDELTLSTEWTYFRDAQVVRMVAWLKKNLAEVLPYVLFEQNSDAINQIILEKIKPFTDKIYKTGGLKKPAEIKITATQVDLDNNRRNVYIILQPIKALKELQIKMVVTNTGDVNIENL